MPRRLGLNVHGVVYPRVRLTTPLPLVYTCRCCLSASFLCSFMNLKSSAHLLSTVCPPASFPVQVAFISPQIIVPLAPFLIAVCVHTAAVRCIRCMCRPSACALRQIWIGIAIFLVRGVPCAVFAGPVCAHNIDWSVRCIQGKFCHHICRSPCRSNLVNLYLSEDCSSFQPNHR